MSQAKHFPVLFNQIRNPFDVMVGVNAMTDSDVASVDSEITGREYRVLTVKRDPRFDATAMSRILFLKVMAGIVMCGKPEDLRVEWEAQPYYDEELDCLACSLMVIGYPSFLERWEDKLNEVGDIRALVAAAGYTDNGMRSLVVPGAPGAHFHEFVTPLPLSTIRALFVSVMLALYDAGGSEKAEISWREEPTAKCEKIKGKDLWAGKAMTLIEAKSRIVVAA